MYATMDVRRSSSCRHPSTPEFAVPCVYSPPPPSSSPTLHLCSCADQMTETLLRPVLSNGAGLEFDTMTPPTSVPLATRNPTGRSLGNVSTAYWNFFDEPEFQVTEEHDLCFPPQHSRWSEHHRRYNRSSQSPKKNIS